MLTDQQVHTIRSRFKFFQSKTYLNTCSQGLLSVAVESGVHDYIASWREQGSPWETWVERYEVARRGRQRLNKFFACEARRTKEIFESFGRHVEKLAQALLNRFGRAACTLIYSDKSARRKRGGAADQIFER